MTTPLAALLDVMRTIEKGAGINPDATPENVAAEMVAAAERALAAAEPTRRTLPQRWPRRSGRGW